jgi:hypothetical protein
MSDMRRAGRTALALIILLVGTVLMVVAGLAATAIVVERNLK